MYLFEFICTFILKYFFIFLFKINVSLFLDTSIIEM